MTAFRMSRVFPFGLMVCFLASGCVTANSVEPAAGETVDTKSMWQATVLVETGDGHGSGVIIGAGSVLTAFHVVNDGAPEIEFFRGERESGAVTWSSEALDLAVVHVGVPDHYAVPALYCGQLAPDQRLVAIGHPLTTRWVSVEGYLDTTEISGGTHLVPLSFDLSLGNSGGPVFDEAGRLVGVASAILVTQAAQEIPAGGYSGDRDHDTGIGLMLPASEFCDEIGAV